MIHGVRGKGHGKWSPREHQHLGDSRERTARKRAKEQRLGELWREAGEVTVSRRWSVKRTQKNE